MRHVQRLCPFEFSGATASVFEGQFEVLNAPLCLFVMIFLPKKKTHRIDEPVFNQLFWEDHSISSPAIGASSGTSAIHTPDASNANSYADSVTASMADCSAPASSSKCFCRSTESVS